MITGGFISFIQISIGFNGSLFLINRVNGYPYLISEIFFNTKDFDEETTKLLSSLDASEKTIEDITNENLIEKDISSKKKRLLEKIQNIKRSRELSILEYEKEQKEYSEDPVYPSLWLVSLFVGLYALITNGLIELNQGLLKFEEIARYEVSYRLVSLLSLLYLIVAWGIKMFSFSSNNKESQGKTYTIVLKLKQHSLTLISISFILCCFTTVLYHTYFISWFPYDLSFSYDTVLFIFIPVISIIIYLIIAQRRYLKFKKYEKKLLDRIKDEMTELDTEIEKFIIFSEVLADLPDKKIE